MKSSDVRVRFAPSPTGFLHIGGVRTAWFNFLFARQKGGKFLLRIEDTDTDRSEDRFTKDIFQSLEWLGMKSDEPVVYQSTRTARYQEIANQLVDSGLAYRCYCSEEEVEAGRQALQAAGKKPMYPRTCREKKLHLNPPNSGPYAIRARVPLTGSLVFQDMIRNEISFPAEDIDDFVMIRSNGIPTYNFVVVVDDLEMKISHVIRGDDHINNTPKQVVLYQALNAEQPIFAHLPMILGEDKKKLSKRNGEVSANAYRADGILPEALLNFLVRLGWSHGDQEIFTVEQMVKLFDFAHVQVSGAVFNLEKLQWIAGEHLKVADAKRLASLIWSDCRDRLGSISENQLTSSFGIHLIDFLKVKVKKITEIADQVAPLLSTDKVAVDGSTLKWNQDPIKKEKIKIAIQDLLSSLEAKVGRATTLQEVGFDHQQIDPFLRSVSEKHGLKLGDLTQPLRFYVTGQATSSIGLFDLLPLMPWKVASDRIQTCLQG